ncbi:hypothetical protein DYE49_02510 [Treponema rectale]|uniref:Nucleotidyltransferase n=1 Tax=Treponema rectale TaxID=744512 RepID=A0A7M1XII9_9SPIR|nr:hypothetical protein DYE49_02510 [Treponema rectale]
MNQHYEFVPKKEYSPVRVELNNILTRLISLCRKDGIILKDELVGSAKHKLITRTVHGNQGFDFDFNLIVEAHNNSNPEQKWNAGYLKKRIIYNLNHVLKKTNYKPAEDSTTAITFKVVDQQNKKIIHSCDLAVVRYPYENNNSLMWIVRRDNTNGSYLWNIRQYTKNYQEKLKWLQQYSNWFEKIKKEYLKLKNNNLDKNKHSFELYYEAINNLYQQYNSNNE